MVKIRRAGSTKQAEDEIDRTLRKLQAGKLRLFDLPEGFVSVREMRDEVHGYLDILLGRIPPPISSGVGSLMEVANAYYSRGKEMEMLIHQAESDHPASPHIAAYKKFRTTELRTFLEVASKAVDLGSRRVTTANMEWEARKG